jgi:flavin-dependent dehydrogenase
MTRHLVIGGGLAGAAVATLLARRGESVTLLEKQAAPAHKVCGEFLSIEAQHYLAQLGVFPEAHGAVPIRQMRLFAGKRYAEATLPFIGLSLTRQRLDAAVLDAARNAGAEVRMGTEVAELLSGAEAAVRLRDGTHLSAACAYLATGKHELRGWARATQRPSSLGFKMLWRLAPDKARALDETVELYLFDGGYAGLEPVEDGMVNLCLALTPATFQCAGKTWETLLAAWAHAAPPFAARLRGATPCWPKPLAVAGVPYGFVHRPTDAPSLFRLGDQMAVIPSFCGDGMAMALHSAFLAAQATDATAYHAQASADFTPLMRRAMTLHRLAHSPAGRWLMPFAQPLLPFFAAQTRLPERVRLTQPTVGAKSPRVRRSSTGSYRLPASPRGSVESWPS